MLPTISIENLRFATVSCHRPTESYERVHPAKAKCASRYNGVPFHISKSTFYYSGVRKNVWIKRRKPGATRGIQKSPFYHSFTHLTSTKWREGSPSKSQICISPQFWTSDQHEVTRGFTVEVTNLHFTTVLDVRWARNDERVARRRRPIRISPQFWTSDEHEVTRGLRRRASKFAFHLSFGRPMSTKWREGCDGDLQNSHFTSVLDVRWARSDERVVSRLDRPNPPCVKKERNFKEVLIHNHSQQIFSADFFSRSSQQIFSADFLQQIFSADLLSRSSQQIFSADLLSRFFSRSSQQIFSADFLQQIFSADFLQQIFSADFLSRSSQQIFSADLLSRSSQQIFSLSYQQIFSADLLSRSSQQIFFSRSSQQIFSADLLSRFSQQIFSADLLSRSSHCLIICCGQGLVVSYCLIILIICCGQGLVVSYCLIICCGQGLVVSYCLIMLVVYTAWVL